MRLKALKKSFAKLQDKADEVSRKLVLRCAGRLTDERGSAWEVLVGH
jgi:hypothetical protein